MKLLPSIHDLRGLLTAPGAHEALIQRLLAEADDSAAAHVFTARFDDDALAAARRADAALARGGQRFIVKARAEDVCGSG